MKGDLAPRNENITHALVTASLSLNQKRAEGDPAKLASRLSAVLRIAFTAAEMNSSEHSRNSLNVLEGQSCTLSLRSSK